MTSPLHMTELGVRGQRVVFCHGLFGQGRNWTQVAKAIAADHRVALVDMPNHGRSEWTSDFSYADAADQVASLLSADDPVALVGHSMGGKIAMLVALRHPELVERLCVVDIAPVDYQRASEFSRFVSAMRGLDRDALTRREDADLALTGEVPDPTVRSFLLQNLRRDGDSWRWQVNLDVLGDGLPALAGWPADLVAGASYDGPVLWVAGARSDYIEESSVPAMEALFPKTRRVTVKNAGHWVHSEQSAIFVEVLRRFLG